MPFEQDTFSRYLAERTRAWLAQPKRSQAQLAELAGVSTAQISNVLDGTRNAARKTARGLALAFKTTWPELERAAVVWQQGDGEIEIPSERFPNLQAAIDDLGGAIEKQTTEVARTVALQLDYDLSVSTWTAVLMDLERARKRANRGHIPEPETKR